MASEKSDFKVGNRVIHRKLGEGDILDIYHFGEDLCAVISFEKWGQKKLMLKYAHLELVPEEESEGGEEES